MRLTSKTDNRPYMNVIFGNFYSPAFDDKQFVDDTMALIRELGFNSVMFDTKAWEDFKERYETGALSQYVEMQEYMGDSAHRHGLAYNFLLLYLNGDNLYPHIRYSPPILGESVFYLDGTPGRWYKYWSPKARLSMKEHVERIMESYKAGCERCVLGDGSEEAQETGASGTGSEEAQETGASGAGSAEARETGSRENSCGEAPNTALEKSAGESYNEVVPVCSMWDPVVAASFDREGQDRYRAYLKRLYGGDIGKLNENYALKKESFEALTPEEYWYSVRFPEDECYTEEDVRERSPRFYVWRDNAFWKMEEFTAYFKEIGPMLKEKNPDLFLCPDMSQWGYFLNIYGRLQADHDNEFSDLWDTALRGIDLYAAAPYVDSCHFITVPATPDGYPDAYVVSCQHSMMRVMNEGRPMVGGIYWGRYIYNDLYAQLSPAEIIGSMTACGMDGYTCYGMNGLDDGGVMNRMEPQFLDSLKRANDWCARVIQKRRGPRKKEIAILFPSEMAALEPFEVGNNKIRRLDLLGWYRYCCDLGYQADVISFHEIERGALAQYRALIVPANDCYFASEHPRMEELLRAWVKAGGAVLHGPMDQLAENCFGIRGEACEKKPYRYGKVIIAQGERFCRYHGGEELAPYVDGEGCCAAKYEGARLEAAMGEAAGSCRGAVYSFGVQIGASYAAKNIPHVPYDQGNKEMYPILQSGSTLVKDILRRHVMPQSGICERGIETGVFENGMVIVNHRSTPYVLPKRYETELYQYPFHSEYQGKGVLGGHEAVWVSGETGERE